MGLKGLMDSLYSFDELAYQVAIKILWIPQIYGFLFYVDLPFVNLQFSNFSFGQLMLLVAASNKSLVGMRSNDPILSVLNPKDDYKRGFSIGGQNIDTLTDNLRVGA